MSERNDFVPDNGDDDVTGKKAGVPAARSTPARRPKTAAQQRADREQAATPAELADDIEQTREDLARTLDAIADKVSPKRVAKRTTKKVGDSVKEVVADVTETVKEKATGAKESLAEKIPVPNPPAATPTELPPLARTLSAPRPSEPQPDRNKTYAISGVALLAVLVLIWRRRHR